MSAWPPAAKPAGNVSFAGKTVAIICGFAAGGPTNLFDRLLARYLPQHLHAVPRSGSFGA